MDFGAPELVIILAVVLLLFGGKKLPELSKGLGESIKNLREGMSENPVAKTTATIKQEPTIESETEAVIERTTPSSF